MKLDLLVLTAIFSALLSACQIAPEPSPSPVTPPAYQLIRKPFEERFDPAAYPEATAALWADGFLWTANETGLLTRWNLKDWQYQQHYLPGDPVIHALASDGEVIYAVVDSGGVWCVDDLIDYTKVADNEMDLVLALLPDKQLPDALPGDLEADAINDLKRAPDGALWLATTSGVWRSADEGWENYQLVDDPLPPEALSLAIARDGTVWATGESYIAVAGPGGRWQVYNDLDNPLLRDRLRFVVLDDQEHPWFVGRRGKIRFDGQNWLAYDADVRHFAHFNPVPSATDVAYPPRDFPSPTEDYLSWLETWPRPESDNGRGMHFLQSHQFDAVETQKQVNRLKDLNARWAVVIYKGHDQLIRAAPIFQEAGIVVVWRPFTRPYETYHSWTEDIAFLRWRGLPPYMQLYNEASLEHEWDGRAVDWKMYWQNSQSAIQQVHEAGGYIGLQFINPDWLRQTLQAMKTQEMNDVFDRLFFVPHPYGLNHPPDYDEDINSALGFREFAAVFEEEIDFVPPMIAGEGGWRLGAEEDNRYPPIDEALHRDYHLAVFDWFRTGVLSNGEPLPDYLFAFSPWLISDPKDPAAWFDSASGDRTLTIEAVRAMTGFERKFSWNE